jgi:hypothetical protein
MFRPYWVIFRQRIYLKELLLDCFAFSRGIVINTSYFAPRLRPLYVVGGEPLVPLCVCVLCWFVEGDIWETLAVPVNWMWEGS